MQQPVRLLAVARARAGKVLPGAGGDVVDAPLRVGFGNAGDGGGQADEIDAILRLQAAMARSGEQDARGLGARVVEIGVGTALGAKQAVEIEGEEILTPDPART